MKGAWISYTAAELAWIERNRTMPRREAHTAFRKKFGRPDVSLSAYSGLCKRKGWLTGRDGRLQTGNVPPNKGKKMPYNANSARTQFKKGQLPHNTKYLGHERVNVDGYVEISVDEKNPRTGFERRYVHKHVYLWELKNGPVPEGMILKNIDGNKLDTDPANWDLMPRSMLLLLNGGKAARGINYATVEPELRPTVMALAKLRHTQAKRKKKKGGR